MLVCYTYLYLIPSHAPSSTLFPYTTLFRSQNTNEHRDIYVDGTAGTPMYAFTGDFEQPGAAVDNLLRFFPGALPFQVMDPEQKRSEEHTSELQSRFDLVCRLLLEKKKKEKT